MTCDVAILSVELCYGEAMKNEKNVDIISKY